MNTPRLLPIALATLRTNFLGPPAVRCGLGLDREKTTQTRAARPKLRCISVLGPRRYISWPSTARRPKIKPRRPKIRTETEDPVSLGTCTHTEVTIGSWEITERGGK